MAKKETKRPILRGAKNISNAKTIRFPKTTITSNYPPMGGHPPIPPSYIRNFALLPLLFAPKLL